MTRSEREAEVATEVGEQLEDLGLGGDVERGGGLVGDEHARSVGQRHREHDPLAEAAGELVRVRARAADRVGDPDRLEEIDRPQLGGAARHARLVHGDRLGHLVADALHRVERGHRVLEHHRQLAAAELAVVAVGEADQRTAVEADVTAGDAPGRVDEPHHRERGHGLARARLPHHRDRLARGERERHAVDRARGRAVAGELDAQVVDLEQRGHARTCWRRGSNASRRPSPTKFTASTVKKIASPGNTVSHQYCSRVAIESLRRLPQLGVGAGCRSRGTTACSR